MEEFATFGRFVGNEKEAVEDYLDLEDSGFRPASSQIQCFVSFNSNPRLSLIGTIAAWQPIRNTPITSDLIL